MRVNFSCGVFNSIGIHSAVKNINAAFNNRINLLTESKKLLFRGNVNYNDIQLRLSKTDSNVIFVKTQNSKGINFGGQNLNNNNILVAGGAGYIGSHTSRYLMEMGYNVVVLDNLSVGNKGAVDELKKIAKKTKVKFKYYKTDLSDTKEVSKILRDNKIDAVVHFAAFSQVGESVKNPLKYYINNTGKTALLLDEMIKNGVNKIVFSSTAATYGEPEKIPIEEKDKQKPINPYGKSKLMIENIMDDLDKINKLKSIRLRYFNVAGSSSDGRLGESHNPETHLIPNILKSVVEKRPFKMFGTDYPTPDGTCVRDYIHVEDLAKAHYLALKKLFDGGKTDFYNLGSGSGYSVKQVVDSAEKVTGKKLNVVVEQRREGDPPVLIASNKKAERELGWKPEKTLDDMISSAWKWFNNKKY